jgi:hypothetical protein
LWHLEITLRNGEHCYLGTAIRFDAGVSMRSAMRVLALTAIGAAAFVPPKIWIA